MRCKTSTSKPAAKRPKTDANAAPDDVDDLDALMAQYEQQAQQDMAKATTKPAKPKNAKEKLQQGLQTQLDEENKGFAMLTKMGYIPGSGLGPPTRQGRAEPIGITMRPPRSGLGVAEAQQQAQQQQEAQRAQRGMGDAARMAHEQDVRAGFVNSQAGAFDRRQHARQLAQAQQTCQALDEGAGIPQHACWPSESKATDVLPQGEQTTQSQAENPPLEGKAPSLQEELLYVLHYLRAQHCYCLYCGMQYGDAHEMREQCPGVTWAAHQEC